MSTCTRSFTIKVGLALDLALSEAITLQEGASLESDILLAKSLAVESAREKLAKQLMDKDLELDELPFDICVTAQLESFQSKQNERVAYVPMTYHEDQEDDDGDDYYEDEEADEQVYVPMSQIVSQSSTPPNGYKPYSQTQEKEETNLNQVLTRLANLIQVLAQK